MNRLITPRTAASLVALTLASSAFAMGPAPQRLGPDSSWSEIAADARLYAAFPQVVFARPDRGVTFASIDGVCETEQEGVAVIRSKFTTEPCIKYPQTGGSDSSVCQAYGAPVYLSHPKNYRDEVCVAWGQPSLDSSHFGCTRREMQDLTISSTQTVEVFTRIDNHNNGWGGHPQFRKEYTIERCQ